MYVFFSLTDAQLHSLWGSRYGDKLHFTPMNIKY